MTREEIEELKGLAASMGLYDDKKPCKRAVILGKAIKTLEQEPCEDATLKDIFCMGCEYKEQEPCREADDCENEISDLHNRLDIVEYDKERLREEVTTLEEKLKGLSAEPCEDAISIEEAIHCLEQLVTDMPQLKLYAQKVADAMRDLHPVYPKPKTGRWEWVQYDYNPKLGNWHCSECRSIVIVCVDKNEKGGIPLYKYCPNCGAKMLEPQESEE